MIHAKNIDYNDVAEMEVISKSFHTLSKHIMECKHIRHAIRSSSHICIGISDSHFITLSDLGDDSKLAFVFAIDVVQAQYECQMRDLKVDTDPTLKSI